MKSAGRWWRCTADLNALGVLIEKPLGMREVLGRGSPWNLLPCLGQWAQGMDSDVSKPKKAPPYRPVSRSRTSVPSVARPAGQGQKDGANRRSEECSSEKNRRNYDRGPSNRCHPRSSVLFTQVPERQTGVREEGREAERGMGGNGFIRSDLGYR